MCVITVDFPLNRYGEDFTSVEKKLYIPPDSEHILNPQVGDLVKITHSKGRVYTDNVNYQEMDTMIFIGHYPYQRTDALCNGIVETEIIQRNKTAFMWPEVEEINNEL